MTGGEGKGTSQADVGNQRIIRAKLDRESEWLRRGYRGRAGINRGQKCMCTPFTTEGIARLKEGTLNGDVERGYTTDCQISCKKDGVK